MRNKVKLITEKIPRAATLADGLYNGTWGGYIIEITSGDKHYELVTEEGVRGNGIKVVVQIENGIATFDTLMS
jgi:hypothetical protein